MSDRTMMIEDHQMLVTLKVPCCPSCLSYSVYRVMWEFSSFMQCEDCLHVWSRDSFQPTLKLEAK